MSNIHLLNDSSISKLKIKAKKISKNRSISLSSALNEIANEVGFPNWKELLVTAKFESHGDLRLIVANTNQELFSQFNDEQSNRNINYSLLTSKYSSLIVEQYTDLQKIGSIARAQGINPKNIQNTIYVSFLENDETLRFNTSDWESWGFYKDYEFTKWLCKNDPFFEDSEFALIFRMLSVDTFRHEDIYEHLHTIHKSTNLIYPLEIDHIWINGKIDPSALLAMKEEFEDWFPDTPVRSYEMPLAEIPTHVWKRGY